MGPRSIRLNSYIQTRASLHFCCWPDDQRETLGKNKQGDKKGALSKEWNYNSEKKIHYCVHSAKIDEYLSIKQLKTIKIKTRENKGKNNTNRNTVIKLKNRGINKVK